MRLTAGSRGRTSPTSARTVRQAARGDEQRERQKREGGNTEMRLTEWEPTPEQEDALVEAWVRIIDLLDVQAPGWRGETDVHGDGAGS